MSVGPRSYTLFRINDDGEVVDDRESVVRRLLLRARAVRATEPMARCTGRRAKAASEAGRTCYPDSGNFRVRAVFLSSDGERRSAYLTGDELTEFPEATPAP